MAIPTLSREPEKIVAGDSVKWSRAFSDYPAPTWTLTYELRSHQNTSGTKITLTAVQDGSTTGFLVSLNAAATEGWPPGTYSWAAYVTSGADRARVDRGIIEIEPDLAKSAADFDPRSDNKKILDAIIATLANKATKDQLSYSINGRSISKIPPKELEEWRKVYEDRYQTELNRLEKSKGGRPGNKVYPRFVR